jgi:hypothetical protein
MPLFDRVVPRAIAAEPAREAISLVESGTYTAAPGAHATHIEVTRESTLAAFHRLLAEGHAAAALNFASAVSPAAASSGVPARRRSRWPARRRCSRA